MTDDTRRTTYETAIHRNLWSRGEHGELNGDVVGAVIAVADAEQEALRAEVEQMECRVLGSEQCCPDCCDGGACETCVGCSAGWCPNGHDFGPGEWESMSADNRAAWFAVAREHNAGIDAALTRAEKAEQQCRDRECTEQDVRARLADAENALARVEALASGAEAWARAHPPLFSDAQFPAIVQVSDLRAALDGKR